MQAITWQRRVRGPKESWVEFGASGGGAKKALDTVREAMLDARKGTPGCQQCKLVGEAGEKRVLQMPKSGKNGKWKTPDGEQPLDGEGIFQFNEPKTLPDGRKVKEIEFSGGSPKFDDYVEGKKYDLWELSGDADTNARRLKEMMSETDPHWKPPSDEDFVLHHFEDGKVGYVPRVIHDRPIGGVAHTGGNSMTNNQLF